VPRWGADFENHGRSQGYNGQIRQRFHQGNGTPCAETNLKKLCSVVSG
jgi:hypothetical protein